jgi:hypothetical protein
LCAALWTGAGKRKYANPSRASSRIFSDHVDVADEEIAQAAPQLESPVPAERATSGAALCLAGRTPIDQAACAILAQLVELAIN